MTDDQAAVDTDDDAPLFRTLTGSRPSLHGDQLVIAVAITAGLPVLLQVPLADVLDTLARHDVAAASLRAWQLDEAFTAACSPAAPVEGPLPSSSCCEMHTAARKSVIFHRGCRTCDLLRSATRPAFDQVALIEWLFLQSLDNSDRALIHAACPHRTW